MSGLQQRRIAILGCGNMGEAIVRGLTRSGKPGLRIVACDQVKDKLEQLSRDPGGVHIEQNPSLAVADADVAVIAVKPGNVHELLQEIYGELQKRGHNLLLISVAAGIRLHQLRAWAGENVRLVRCMPNLPATVGAGITAVLPEEDADWKPAKEILAGVGEVVRVTTEGQLDAVTALSAGGPAYACLVVEALADGGVKCGLPRDVAQKLAVETLAGTAEYLKRSGHHPAAVRERVCSPGGTTIAALQVLERAAVRAAFVTAIEEAVRRAEQLGSPKKQEGET
jgi:pyrroline-5-carboxylate reductase